MIESALERVRAALATQFGITIRASRTRGAHGSAVRFRLDDIRQEEGFSVKVEVGWRSAHATLELGNYASELVHVMQTAGAAERALFEHWFQLARESGRRPSLRINELETDPRRPETWQGDWRTVRLGISRTGVDIEEPGAEEAEVRAQASLAMGMALSLITEPVEDLSVVGEPEGDVSRIQVNRYERSRLNRALCIQARGSRCLVCGFDFGQVYGAIGASFINVHHIVPVSRLGPGFRIDPLRDLIPVCSNCHSMLHRQDPPLLPDELKNMIRLADGSESASEAAEDGQAGDERPR